MALQHNVNQTPTTGAHTVAQFIAVLVLAGWTVHGWSDGTTVTRDEISVAGMAVIPGDGGAWHTLGSWRFDPADWPAGVTLSLRAEGSVGPTLAIAGQARLVRAADGYVDLDGLSWSDLDVVSIADTWTAPGVATAYLIQARHDPAAAPTEALTVYGVRVVVEV